MISGRFLKGIGKEVLKKKTSPERIRRRTPKGTSKFSFQDSRWSQRRFSGPHGISAGFQSADLRGVPGCLSGSLRGVREIPGGFEEYQEVSWAFQGALDGFKGLPEGLYGVSRRT